MRSIDLQGIEAKVNVMKAIRKRPSSAENWLSLFLQSKETRAGGQIQKIIETLSPKSVNDSWGTLVQIDASISNGTADLNQLITQADAIITQSTSVQVKHVGYCILGRILEMAKNYEGAAKSFKTALLIGCNHTPLVMLMRMYAKLGLFDAAKACYLYAVNNNTEKLMIILEYVKLCMNANELQIASEIISEAIKLNPTDARVLFLTSSLQGETPVL
jgi:tetratricopeptide (TPR) repeat protein